MRLLWKIPFLFCVGVPTVFAIPAAHAGASLHEPNAVLVNVTVEDLNRLARDAFRENGTSRLEGRRERLSPNIRDVAYRALLSEPTLTLAEGGLLRLRFDVLEGDLSVGRIERKILLRRTECRDLGLAIEPERPLDVRLDLRVAVEDGLLRLDPEHLRVAGDGHRLRLRRPRRCLRNPLPEWLLWKLGKPRLRRRLAELDAMLLERARAGVDRWNEREAASLSPWPIPTAPGATGEPVRLVLRDVDTGGGALRIALAGVSDAAVRGGAQLPSWAASLATESWVAVSERFVNHALRAAFSGLDERRFEPRGDFHKAFRSTAIFNLIPGLRELEDRDGIFFKVRLTAPPTASFEPAADDAATIRLELGGVEVGLWKTEHAGDLLLGNVDVDAGAIAVRPYVGPLGGISFAVAENEWRVSSRGIEFNDELLASTIQEIVFGELFETGYEPVARGEVGLFGSELRPRSFRALGEHLLMGLAAPQPAATRTDSLHASR